MGSINEFRQFVRKIVLLGDRFPSLVHLQIKGPKPEVWL